MGRNPEIETGLSSIMQVRSGSEDINSHRIGYKYLLWVVGLQSLVVVGLVAAIFYSVTNIITRDSYFAETYEGRKGRLVALNTPNINRQTILTWASAAVTDIMTFGFNDLDRRFSKTRENFSPEGWESFKKAMGKSGILNDIAKFQQIITSIPKEPPTLQSQGIINEKYSWVVNMKIVMTIRAGDKQVRRFMDIRLVIIKMPTAQNPMGIGIQTFYGY